MRAFKHICKFDHGINSAINRLRKALGDPAETPRFIETLPRRGYRFIGRCERDTSKPRSLAVLPLEDLSRDPEREYFADGLTEALNPLAKIGDLRGIRELRRCSTKRVRKNVREIARELDVDSIVEGTVLRVGERVRITAQLIDATKESHLWAESYERDLRDVLSLQSEVAQSIAREIRISPRRSNGSSLPRRTGLILMPTKRINIMSALFARVPVGT